MQIKLINLNVWFGGQYLWDNIVEYLSVEQPDIVFLQEAYASKNVSPAAYMCTASSLQKQLKYAYAEYETQFILKREHEIAPVGNAILSRFPLTNKKVLWLQGTRAVLADDFRRELIPTFPRNLLHCQAEIEGQICNLMTLQGVWAEDGTETEAQKQMGKKIFQYIQGKENVLLGGDFNVNEYTETINSLEKDLVNIFKGERISSFNMKHKNSEGYATAIVDFIFASPNIKISDHYTSSADVSDHQSQVIIFDL